MDRQEREPRRWLGWSCNGAHPYCSAQLAHCQSLVLRCYCCCRCCCCLQVNDWLDRLSSVGKEDVTVGDDGDGDRSSSSRGPLTGADKQAARQEIWNEMARHLSALEQVRRWFCASVAR